MRPRTERRTSLPARASSTPTPATWSPGSWWSRRPAGRCTRFTAGSSSTRSGWTRPGWKGHEPARTPDAAHHYSGELDWTTISPTIDWAGGGLVTTAPDLARFVRALWSGGIVGSRALGELTRWTPAASFPPGHALRYERYGLGTGTNTVEGVELLGHTGFIGAFAFHAPEYDAVLAGSHNDSQVDRWPLVAALCRELRQAA